MRRLGAGPRRRSNLLAASAWVAVLACMLSVPRGTAYTGGPVLVDVLGWDPSTKRVYFHDVPTSEVGDFGATYYFDLRSEHPATPRQLPWSHVKASTSPTSPLDSLQLRRLEALQTRLRPLQMELSAVIPWPPTVLGRDSVPGPEGHFKVPRYLIRIYTHMGSSFEVRTYWHPEAYVKDVYRVPQRDVWIYVLTFRGQIGDGAAETQVPVLFTSGNVIPRVTWDPGR